jgi:type I restriction enzyme, S subunit
MTWRVRTLGEICDEVGGVIQTGPFGSQLHESDYVEEGIPVVMPKNIVDGRVSTEDIARISEVDGKRLQRHMLAVGDIVYGRRGDIGRRALITERERGWLCGTGCLRVSLGDTVLDSTFLYYYLGESSVTNWIANQAIGATLPNLNTSILRSVSARYPSLSIQRRIACILSAYDHLIENNIGRIKLVKNISETIFKGARTHSGKFWNFVPISDLYVGLYDGPHATPKPSESGPIFLGIQNVTERGELDLSSIRHIAEQDFATWTRRVLPSPGDIVFTYEATLHRYGMIREGFRGCLGRRLALIRPDLDLVDPYFLLYSLLDDEWRREVTSKIISGATVDRVPLTNFPRFQLRVPTLAVQREIGASIRACEELADNCSRRNRILRATRDFLLSKLISGDIDVENIDAETVAQGV